MAITPPALPPILAPALRHAKPRPTFCDHWRAARPLLPPAIASCLSGLGLVALLYLPALRVFDAGWLPYDARLQAIAERLVPDALLNGAADSPAAIAATWLYVAVVAAMCGSWGWALWTARTLDTCSRLPLMVLTAIVAAPLIVAPGLVSDDVYLYNLYGRAIAVYGANPILSPPAAFPSDPHLPWVHWTELPSAYGPIWLMLSALSSALAGDSIDAVVIVYRLVALGLHLMVIGVLWRVLHEQRQGPALPAALFYAWNPLVVLEVVGNAHNDVLVALFAIALIGATMQRRWTRAAIYGACAVMVKPFAVILAPVVLRQLWQQPASTARYRQLALATAVGVAVVFAVNLPLGSGHVLIRNAWNNPAATMYANTVWDLGLHWWGGGGDAVRHPGLDALRGVLFLAGVAGVVRRRVRREDVPGTAVRVWLVFCLTAGWVWPWYFVPLLALAPLAGASVVPAAIALTIGGLLFWAGWPERHVGALQTLYTGRSLLLFGPLILVCLWAPARAVLSLARGRVIGGVQREPSLDGLDRVLSTAHAEERPVEI